MRSFLIVVRDVLPENSLEVALTQYKDVVQALPPCCSHESLSDGVRLRSTYRGAENPQSLRAEHLSERP